MKTRSPHDNFKKLILHFNIDKTIVMRDINNYNNPEYTLREILSELIWGKEESDAFKVIHPTLEFDKSKIAPELINYKTYISNKYKLMTQEEFDKLEDKENKKLDEINSEKISQKTKCILDILEPHNPGFKFKRVFEDMEKKLKIDEKIQEKLGIDPNNCGLNEEQLNEKDQKFTDLGDDVSFEEKFKKIFRNGFHNIIISFFTALITLRKNKQDFAVVFRFFGHEESDIAEFVFEFNKFIEGNHPRFCGEFGYNKIQFDAEKDKYKISYTNSEYIGISYRSNKEQNEKFFFGTLSHPIYSELEENRDQIEEFYLDDNSSSGIMSKGYNEIYDSLMEKLNQNPSFVILDDYSFYKTNKDKSGKLYLIDPYDTETLQIFFDTNIDENSEKIDIFDIVTKKKLNRNYYINKFLVNVEPFLAISDLNYFTKKINECIINRKAELLKDQGKEAPIIPLSKDFEYENEIKKIPGAHYLQMTVMPLLSNALNLCEMLRPTDPIAFIANYMLTNKDYARKLEDIIKEIPIEKKDKMVIELEEKYDEEEPEDTINSVENKDANIEKEENKKIEEVKKEEVKEEEKTTEKFLKTQSKSKASRPTTKNQNKK